MITLHHLENSRSQRILWLLEELEIPYEIIKYKRHPVTMFAPPELRQVHPLGKSPVITDGDKTVAESAVILEYILDKYGNGKLRPLKTDSNWYLYQYWLHYAEGSLMPPLLMDLIFTKVATKSPVIIRPIAKAIAGNVFKMFITPQKNLHMDYMESQLQKSKWFAGAELTAADMQMSFPVEAALARNKSGKSYPHLAQFLQNIHSRPAYKRALEKGGPYEILT